MLKGLIPTRGLTLLGSESARRPCSHGCPAEKVLGGKYDHLPVIQEIRLVQIHPAAARRAGVADGDEVVV